MKPSPGYAYLDWNATAPLRTAARLAMLEALELFGNPSSVHGPGRAARSSLEASRDAILTACGAPKAQLIFTSGGSESNILALRGLIQAAAAQEQRITRLFVSAIEHTSVLETARRLADDIPGVKVALLPVTTSGVLNLDALRDALMQGKGRALVSIMAANNETGVVQPVAQAAALAKAHGALVHCDAVQVFGRVPLSLELLGVDALSVAAHKAGGPKGIGALILREGLAITPQLTGGGQETGLRAGTQNVAGAAGMAAIARADLAVWAALRAHRDSMETALLASVPGAQIYGRQAERLPNTTCIGLPGVSAQTQLMALDLDGVAVSSGSACSSGKVARSHVLEGMGVSEPASAEAIRVSIGPETTHDDTGRFIKAWTSLASRASRLIERPAAE
ncbi:MAG TPA: cysteine desulfurase [Alphaproteobacteria bacterium]|nr:cysteine desulfurase [Alphaproteobacteria bacterium]HAJ46392.1 cysteine desulfurase [Alphaproteobacteria bacterium]